MTHVKNVIQTSDVFASALQHLNRGSVINLLEQIMSISQDANQELSVDLNTKISAAKLELQTSINVLSVKTDQALAAAKILEGAELDQLVTAFKKFIETTGMQKIIQDAAVKIGHTTYRLGSVLEVMALADKDAEVEIMHNAAGTEITGVRYTLTDGYTILFSASYSEEEGNGVRRYTFVTDNWRGLTVQFICKYRRVSSQYSFFGRQLASVAYLPIMHSNLVFDLCNKFEILNELTESDVLPDLSGLATAGGAAPGSSGSTPATGSSGMPASS